MTDAEDNLVTGGGLQVVQDLLEQPDPLLGTVVGDYKLTQVLGAGGMGVVYRAARVDGNFERAVAIKVVPSAAVSTELRRRFAQEQSLLAALDHPNISRLYDAQISTTGLPYMVMELIEGQTVDRFCDARGNSIPLAVQTTIDVAAAVTYAHAHLIVHRDIKPGNIMIDSFNQPKLLDFGIAKLLEGERDDGSLAFPMTPRFASPEQLLQRPVTIASDIYQLGALLYRLVVGRSVFEGRSLEQMMDRANRQHDWRVPVEARRQLPRDLVLILERCLRWEPADRYSSVDAFSKDMIAFSKGFPVEVGGSSVLYRASRFLGRNRALVTVVTVALVLLTATSASYTLSLREARSVAETQAASATRTSNALSQLVTESMSDLQDQIAEYEIGAPRILESVFEDAIKLAAQELDGDDAAKAELYRIRANAEWRLGRFDEAGASFLHAKTLASAATNPVLYSQIQLDSIRLALEERLLDVAAAELSDLDAQIDIGGLPPAIQSRYRHIRGYHLFVQDEFAEAADAYREALEGLNVLNSASDRERAQVLTDLGIVHLSLESYEETRTYTSAAVELLERSESAMSHRLIEPLRVLALSLGNLDDYASAQSVSERALQIATANYGENHREVGRVHSNLSSLNYRQGDIHRAIEHEKRALRVEQLKYGGDSWDTIVTRYTLALYLGSAGRIREALAATDELLGELRERDGLAGRRLQELTLASRSRWLSLAGDFPAAVDAGKQALTLRRELQGEGSYGEFDSQRQLSYVLAAAGEWQEARTWYESSLRGLEELVGRQDEKYRTWFLRSYLFDRAAGDYTAAREKLRQYVTVQADRYVLDSPHFLNPVVDLAEACLELQDVQGAKAAIAQVGGAIEDYPEHPDAMRGQLVRAELLLEQAGAAADARVLAQDLLAQLSLNYPRRADLLLRARYVLDQS
ncbi:MAG: protein kinase [Pseudomonadota bacterium]